MLINQRYKQYEKVFFNGNAISIFQYIHLQIQFILFKSFPIQFPIDFLTTISGKFVLAFRE